MIRASLRLLIVLAALLTASSSEAAHKKTWPEPEGPTKEMQPDSLALDWSTVPEYRIVPGDVITLDFGPRADLNGDILRDVIVRPDGRISVFPVGDVIAAGRTPRELETALVGLLSADIRAPRVTVELTKMAANEVHVLGEVNHAGPIPADPYMTVVQAIAAAGGFKEGAAKNSVLVYSRNGANTLRVAMGRVAEQLKYKGLQGDLRLSRFDIVYVPRGPVGNIDAFTRQLFGGLLTATEFGISGWELFHLDRVFFVPTGH